MSNLCSSLAGVVVVQTVLYIMFFPDDSARIKAMACRSLIGPPSHLDLTT